ncbi:hypothetical protein LOTGIDRAFT_153829 [Lottia gigantea]|uniref:Chitin-binding type-2 domain-containing protein n=1 Tax=Lottia gigantea TaxID=225164 RepID=V4ADK3_LOTGI|nr:hypothetical protein LOTGIDRAFT_153829 [Lottia gigantea]ESO91391.1 hypothetical protein LOTGIDRAFT_153829 [Lottia gigantea]
MKRLIGITVFAGVVLCCVQAQQQPQDPQQPASKPSQPVPSLADIFPGIDKATAPDQTKPNQPIPNQPPTSNQIPQQPPFPGQIPNNLPPFPGQLPQSFPGQSPINQGQAFPGQGFPNQGRMPNTLYPFLQQAQPTPFQGPFVDPFQPNPYAFQPNMRQFQINQAPFPQPMNPFSQVKDSKDFSQFLYCQVANGTMPDWTDPICQKYWSCTNFNLTLTSCAADQAYDYSTKECTTGTNVKCQKQNVDFWQVLQSAMNGAAQPPPTPQFTPLSSLPGNRLNITLETDVCTRLGANLPRLESVTNSALLNLSNCPFNNCNMTLITFVCQ